jgi:hypothetical protein
MQVNRFGEVDGIRDRPCRDFAEKFSNDDKCRYCGFSYEDHVGYWGNDFRVSRRVNKEVVKSVRVKKLPGRNDLCPCGSGKKYKHCCLNR